jgi:protein TonB
MTLSPRLRERTGAALATAAVVAALGYALVLGLAVHWPAAIAERSLATFAVLPDPPPPPVKTVPPPRKIDRPTGAAAPPNLRSKATEVTAPVPVILTVPPPIVVAPLPSIGIQSTSGAADRIGPGTGAGGDGDGTGGGGDGDGDGSDRETPPRHIAGNVRGGDLPAWARQQGFKGTVAMRFYVGADGRVSDCRIARSSGNAEIDALTCRVIEQRFRYRPWRDGDGQPVASTVLREQEWDIDGTDPATPGDQRR